MFSFSKICEHRNITVLHQILFSAFKKCQSAIKLTTKQLTVLGNDAVWDAVQITLSNKKNCHFSCWLNFFLKFNCPQQIDKCRKDDDNDDVNKTVKISCA